MNRYDDARAALAILVKALLVMTLGGKCEVCGGTLLSVLEIDHSAPEGAGWSRRREGSLNRVLRYCAEYRAGVPLRVLCRRCNARDGANRGNAWWYEDGRADQPAIEEVES